jgi:hypothetical protein
MPKKGEKATQKQLDALREGRKNMCRKLLGVSGPVARVPRESQEKITKLQERIKALEKDVALKKRQLRPFLNGD